MQVGHLQACTALAPACVPPLGNAPPPHACTRACSSPAQALLPATKRTHPAAPSALPAHPQVHVYPLDHEKAQAAIAATHTKQPKEGILPRRERRLEE